MDYVSRPLASRFSVSIEKVLRAEKSCFFFLFKHFFINNNNFERSRVHHQKGLISSFQNMSLSIFSDVYRISCGIPKTGVSRVAFSDETG